MLISVQNDREVMRVKRRGRFAIEVAAAASPAHMEAAMAEMRDRMLEGLGKQGFRYVGEGWTFALEDHVDYSEDASADPGSASQPDPRDLNAWAAWERAERARVARKMGLEVAMVDVIMITVFERDVPRSQRVLPHSLLSGGQRHALIRPN